MSSVSVGSEGARYRRVDVMLLALTLAAGHVDALGYLALGGVFTANMTGNTVLLGLHVSLEQGAAVVRSLVALGGFGAGLLIGALVVERRRESTPWPPAVTWALGLEAAILGAFAVGFALTGPARERPELHGLILLSAVAMGIQSAAVRRLNVPGIATTYMTGTLTSAVTGLVARSRANAGAAGFSGGAGPFWLVLGVGRTVKLQLLSLLLYGIGAMIAGLALPRWPMLGAIAPVLVVLSVVGVATRLSGNTRG